MRRHAPYLLALPIAWCVTTQAAAQSSQATGGAVPEETKARLEAPVALHGKTVIVGAEPAERWSATLAAALSRNSASQTVQSQLELADAYYSIGILDKASELYGAVARRVPRQAAAWDGLARIWRDWGYPQLGLGDAHRAVWADPRSPVVRNTLGTILQLLGKSREAKEQFARAASLDPQAAYAQYNLGVACMALGQHAEAAVSFERAAALDVSLDAARVRAGLARQQAAEAAAGRGGNHERR